MATATLGEARAADPARPDSAARLRPARAALGGPDAVTWPAFWVSLATILLGNLTTGGSVPVPWPERIALIFLAQVVMFLPLIALRFTLLSDPERPRPVIGLAALVLAPILRGLVFAGMLAWAAPGEDPNLAHRVASGATGLTIVLIITALAVHALRGHRRRLQRLLDLRDDLLASQREATDAVSERNAAAVDRLRTILIAQLDSVNAADSQRQADSLERFAQEVVRPMSHELAQAIPDPAPGHEGQPRTTVTRREVLDAALAGRPFRPWTTAALLAIMVLFSLVSLYGPRVALGVLAAEIVAVPLALALGNAVLTRVQRARTRVAAGIVFCATPLIAALTLAVIVQGLFASTMDTTLLVASCFVFVPLVSVPLALARATRQQQEALEAEIRASTASLQRQVCRLQQLQWFQHKALSRALHGPVQSSVTAAVLALRGQVLAGAAMADPVLEVRGTLLEAIDVLGTQRSDHPPLDESLARISGLWSSLCGVGIDVAAAADSVLEDDPVLRSCVVDLVTEAVSNAVRHGGATRIDVTVDRVDDDLAVTVVDDGSGTPSGSSPGLGTRQLDDCSLTWARVQAGDRHVLTARLPIGA